jgi:hypothetical protein
VSGDAGDTAAAAFTLAAPLAETILAQMRAQLEASRLELSGDLLPRLEEVSGLIGQAYLARLAGVPNPTLEAILEARWKLLVSASSSEVGVVVRGAAQQALLAAVGGVFRLLIAAV